MRRKALLIGNTRGLSGVQVDIKATHAFLQSPIGGAWEPSEVTVMENPTKSYLLTLLQQIRGASFDFVFLLFSGHGGALRNSTLIELNGNGETVDENLLFELAPRQVSVFDCCRATVGEVILEKAFAADGFRNFAAASDARARFENRVMASIPQQVRLYSCSIGQVSNDTSGGGVYLQHLLAAARNMSSGQEYKTLEEAHSEACQRTIADPRVSRQTPDAVLPKCLTSQQLIISVKP
jgi:hypothetical protein